MAARIAIVGATGNVALRIGQDILFNHWHREVERYLEVSSLAWTHLCPSSFMQNFITFDGPSIRHEGRMYQPMGEGRVAHIDARDIAAVAAEVLLAEDRRTRALRTI
jgi:uncharacterized protein YbjT (DUF2867 family)